MTRIKICGLSRPCDIEYVNEAKPDFCGFLDDYMMKHGSFSILALRKNGRGQTPARKSITINQPQYIFVSDRIASFLGLAHVNTCLLSLAVLKEVPGHSREKRI